MADFNQTKFRNTRREDPRLAKADVTASSAETTSELQKTNWPDQNLQYNTSLQTTYQHLPPSMYSDANQYSAPQTYQNTYAGYQYGTSYGTYESYTQPPSTYMPTTAGLQTVPPAGDGYPQTNWNAVGGYVEGQAQSSNETKTTIYQELQQHNEKLIHQLKDYCRRSTMLKAEVELLREQKRELTRNKPIDRETEHILKKNSKLQSETLSKLKDTNGVIEILTNLINNGPTKGCKGVDSPKKERSSTSFERSAESKYNYIHYDPELHWCRMCDIFPKTAKDFLMHLHNKEHRDMMLQENVEIPWHKEKEEDQFPVNEGAPKKRLPIKGLQFFVSSTAWYCRLCDRWIGDLHCASQHLKSINHFRNYSNFVEQNPHWEIEWLKDREKALERMKRSSRNSDSDRDKKKKRKSPSNFSTREKKKKRQSKKRKKDTSESSSSSSSSASSSEDENRKDTSKSIHVAMRNKMKLQAQMLMNEDIEGKWEAFGRLVEEHKRKGVSQQATETTKAIEPEDKLNQWMTVQQPQDKGEKIMLDSLKERLRQKHEIEKQKSAEADRKRLEKERELQAQKEKEEKELQEKEEAKRREKEELLRLKEIREQVKFKTKDKPNRRQYSRSKSPDSKHSRNKVSRSPSSERKRSPQGKRHKQKNGGYSSDESPEEKHKRKHESSRKPPPPPSYKKLPFIGRMPLFKNKKNEERVGKEIKKEDYDIPRQTRFQPGNLARAFIPEPEVVCFPKLSSYPPITIPPPPAPVIKEQPPEAPKITLSTLQTPPAPKITDTDKKGTVHTNTNEVKEDEKDDDYPDMSQMEDDNPLNDYHEPIEFESYSYNNSEYGMMYPPPPPMFDFVSDTNNREESSVVVPLSHTMPLQPPPLPPDDPSEDLALLGISTDDLAAQLLK